MSLKESDAEKQSRRQAEAAFNQQQELLTQQQAFLEQSNSQAQHILSLLEEAEAGNVESAELAQQALNDALAGKPTEAQLQFEEDIRLQGAERIRRQLGPGGESSSPGIEQQGRIDEAIAASRDARRQGDIQAAVQAGSLAQGTFAGNLEQQLAAATNPLVNTQALGQSITNLGKLSQFNQPRDDSFLRDLGIGAVSALGSTPNFTQNIKGNVQGINAFLRGKGVPYVPFI